MAETKHAYMDTLDHPLKFVLEIPTNVSAFSTIPHILQKGLVGLTNIDRGDISTLPDVSDNADNFIYIPKLPYSATRINFDYSVTNDYKQIINIAQLLPGVDNTLFNYALLNKGQTLTDNIMKGVKTILGVESAVDDKEVFNILNQQGFGGFLKGMLYSVADISTQLGEAGLNMANKGVDVLDDISQNVGADQSILFSNIGKKGASPQTIGDAKSSDRSLKNFNAFLSPKMWGGTSNAYPSIELKLSYICEKDTDTLVDLLNWVQEIASPLTLLLPVIPLKLSIFRVKQNKNVTDNPFLTGMLGNMAQVAGSITDNMDVPPNENLGIRPLTYTQHNYGFFNVIGVIIKDLGLGYANNDDSKFYNTSGIPLPIGVEVTLNLEAFDPFFYQMYTPNKAFDSESGGN